MTHCSQFRLVDSLSVQIAQALSRDDRVDVVVSKPADPVFPAPIPETERLSIVGIYDVDGAKVVVQHPNRPAPNVVRLQALLNAHPLAEIRINGAVLERAAPDSDG